MAGASFRIRIDYKAARRRTVRVASGLDRQLRCRSGAVLRLHLKTAAEQDRWRPARLRLLSTATAQQRGAALATAPALPDTAISLDGVSVRLGDRLALAGITARVRTGAFVGLLGPNGSGKSTLLPAAPRALPPPP